ncbi:hypothetical protein [Cellulosilyticum sp. I15G10I2]|uniref:hypothetical protein n=1 Tax=Cellulosilyticum sp. I15G10I2 TaxID=1892843 RepID=UPI00085C2EA5|nr:hypothetical protein [Cellulosilyticum sp. I15G10I2]
MDLMNHPAFKGVDQGFLSTLQGTINSLSYKSDIEIIGTLMAVSNEAKKKNVNFTPDMQAALLDHLKSRIPVNKRAQFEAFVSLMTSKMG